MARALESFYRGKTILVTGHSGFKGGWLCTWLKALGARVAGFALPPPYEQPSFFKIAGVPEGMNSQFGDVRDPRRLPRFYKTMRRRLFFIWQRSHS